MIKQNINRDIESLFDSFWVSLPPHEKAAAQPTLSVGAEIVEGVITGVCQHPRLQGRYEVREHGCADDSRRLLVKFEDAQEVQ